MPENKIILTVRELSKRGKELLESIATDGYQTMPLGQLEESQYADVEILLLDMALPDDRNLLSEEYLRKFAGLKLIQGTRAGVDAIDFEKIPPKVIVCGNVGAYGDQIAEHVLGMIIYFARNLGTSHLKLKQGIWEIPSDSLYLNGKNILILGTGGIGDSVARLAKCFGMKTLGINSSGRPVAGFDQTFSIDRINQVLGSAEIIVIALPLTVKTFHLIDRVKLQMMKKDAILVNVARGYVIDEEALYTHMRENPEFKCALDVWWWYPKPGEKFAQKFPFFDLANFLGTPHDSGNVPETEEIALLSAIENIGRFIRNEALKGAMDRSEYSGLRALISNERKKP